MLGFFAERRPSGCFSFFCLSRQADCMSTAAAAALFFPALLFIYLIYRDKQPSAHGLHRIRQNL
ncbi:hypothetical protein BN871_AK_00050 [Paenibacillus sp. P22]|nr:hypothetical protein BN871_AK_00050 [Paenibacillus sp. P22]